MRSFRRLFLAAVLTATFTVPAWAGATQGPSAFDPGETSSPPCTPGETSGPPCKDPGESNGPPLLAIVLAIESMIF